MKIRWILETGAIVMFRGLGFRGPSDPYCPRAIFPKPEAT
jgi:hypothetical protein